MDTQAILVADAVSRLGEELEAVRARLDVSMRALAKRIEVSPQYVNELIQGTRKGVSSKVAVRIARGLGEPTSKWLRLAGHGDMVDDLMREDLQDYGTTTSEGQAAAIDTPTGFLRRGEFAIRMPDPGMPAEFPEGALVAVEPTARPPSAGLVTIQLNDGTRTIRYRRAVAGRVEYVANNPEVLPIGPGSAKVVGIPRRVHIVTVKEVQP